MATFATVTTVLMGLVSFWSLYGIYCKFQALFKELQDLRQSYKIAIDGKLAAEREVERMKAKMAKIKQELEQ